MLMQVAILVGALFLGIVAIALVYVLGMRAKSPLVLEPPHPAPARDHQPEADAIGGHARSVRVRDPASRPDLGPTVRDARRGRGRRRRVPDRARVRVTHELAPERAGERVRHDRARGAQVRGRPAGAHPDAGGGGAVRGRRSARLPSARRRPGPPGPAGRAGRGRSAGHRRGPGRSRHGSVRRRRPGRWGLGMSPEPRTVVGTFAPKIAMQSSGCRPRRSRVSAMTRLDGTSSAGDQAPFRTRPMPSRMRSSPNSNSFP